MRLERASAHSEEYVSVLLLLGVLLAAVGFWALRPPAVVRSAMSEGGLVEMLTVAVYGLAAVAAWALPDRRLGRRLPLALMVTLLAFGARELDWHRSWTGGSVLKLGFYFGPHPLPVKLIALALVGISAAALIYLMRRCAGPLLSGLRRCSPVAITAATFLAVLLASKALDRSLNMARELFGITFHARQWALQLAVEESLELLLPMLVIVGLLQHRRRVRRAPGGSPADLGPQAAS